MILLSAIADLPRPAYSITSSARASSVGGTSRPSAFAVLRLITSSNLVVRGHSGPTQQRHTGLGCAGSGCAPLFATCWKQPQAAWEALSSLPQFRLSLGLDLVHVPFNGGAPSVASVVAGHTPVGFTSPTAAVPQIKDGKLRALAVTSKARSQTLLDVETMAEAGYPDIEGDSWVGVLVPAGTPKEIITLLNREIVTIISQPDMRERLVTLGYDPVAGTPEEFAQRIKVEIGTWGKVIRAANIKAQ